MRRIVGPRMGIHVDFVDMASADLPFQPQTKYVLPIDRVRICKCSLLKIPFGYFTADLVGNTNQSYA